jgi:Sec-independent protein secretion pathway component TatC
MAVPMYLLFEGGILFAAILQRGGTPIPESAPEQESN